MLSVRHRKETSTIDGQIRDLDQPYGENGYHIRFGAPFKSTVCIPIILGLLDQEPLLFCFLQKD